MEEDANAAACKALTSDFKKKCLVSKLADTETTKVKPKKVVTWQEASKKADEVEAQTIISACDLLARLNRAMHLKEGYEKKCAFCRDLPAHQNEMRRRHRMVHERLKLGAIPEDQVNDYVMFTFVRSNNGVYKGGERLV